MQRNLNLSSGGRRILGVPEVGILAATIASQTASGDNGPGLLYDESIAGANAGKQLRCRITAWPSAGTLFVHENGAVDFTGPDGAYTIGYNAYADDVLIGSDTATLTVGSSGATAAGATLSGTSTIAAGAATGDGAAPGATLAGTSTLTPGAASGTGAGSGTAPGATLTGTATLSAGSAVGGSANATAPGATLTGTSTLIPGAATSGNFTAADIDPDYLIFTRRNFAAVTRRNFTVRASHGRTLQ